MEARATRPRSFVGPVILIAVGVIILLSNLGLMDRNSWNLIFQFWPLVLVAIGLDILVRRGTGGTTASVAGLAIALLVVLAIAAAIVTVEPRVSVRDGVLITTVRGQESVVHLGQAVRAEAVSQTLDGAERAVVELNLGVDQVHIGGTREPSSLVQASLALDEGERVIPDYRVSDGTGYFILRTDRQSMGRLGASFDDEAKKWDILLNADVPMELKINGGVGVSRMDLSQLRLSRLEVNAGVGTSELTLPGSGQYQATINAGVGKVTVLVPRGMAARIQTERGLSSIDVQGSYQRAGSVYTSPGYEGATDRLDLTIYGGVGKVSVQEY